jgi:hypothetical protein
MQEWFSNHQLVTYVLILACIIYIFNAVFRVKRLPILKEVIVHLVMAFGAFILFILQVDKLPILQCMAVAIMMMMMLRGRQLYDKLRSKRNRDVKTDSGQ